MTLQTAKATLLDLLQVRLPAIHKDKSGRYGETWYDNGSEDAVPYMFCEVNAKFKRLHKMAWRDRATDKASCAETYIDLALYAAMSAAVLIDSMNADEYAALQRKLEA